ncbi:uncharacterized protein N7446_009103 [Penicillium canescens]|uniref:Uncharacterized protein n=1 Tax=Penicillium canescens TaxID=5083 RepID=A0AAD6I5X5_PENCN|nr:uncharacterized protein N7446_009103 [Penicillium canescens]KAJ6034354.1 hypothetical protein N7460_008529 [Penicillium canescens]KAJ6053091.1 hypothetical protein N7446_009103 [Penicillium canescens]KAJ6165176.1 hypothetical protein N7485_008420 [Penicillium canescens]
MDDQQELRTAPTYPVPSRLLVSVEHPAVVRNVDKAIETLQGDTGIKTFLNPAKPDIQANLVLRPDDAMARPLQSTSSASNNVLVKVTVPKRTGRKRKKGSDEPFMDAPESEDTEPRPRRSAKDLMRSLSDNQSAYHVEPVGKIQRTHVFRGMPDFVYSTTASSFTNRFRDQILPFDFEKMKQFELDMSKGATLNADIIPPPSFSHGDVPFHYIYRQNPTVKQSIGQSGEITTVNTQQVHKVLTYLVPYDIEKVPTEPRPDLPPISTLDSSMRETINKLRALYETQPAWTRRGLRNNLTTDEDRTNLRHAVPYVGYIFRSGPWRDAIIKLGIDPRTSPDYRHYQTFMFRLLAREAELARDGASGRRHNLPRPFDLYNAQLSANAQNSNQNPEDGTSNTHIFTGKLPFSADGKIWMISEIQDPQLKQALYPPPEKSVGFLREECEIVADGWYGNGTLGKAKTVMRHKIQALMEGREADDSEFWKVMELPDHARSEADFEKFTFDGDVSSREMQLATEVRSAIRGSPIWNRLEGSGNGGRGKGKGKGKERKKGKDLDEGPEKGKGKGKPGKAGKGKKGKEVAFEEPDAEEQIDEPSEGEEEEIQRREMLAEQVAAAAEARDADQDDDESDNSDEEGSD